jgi:hypothetical protein
MVAIFLHGETNKIYYAFPVGVSLALWSSQRRLLVERDAPDLGWYDVELDLSISKEWLVFEGESVPGSWDDWLFRYPRVDAHVSVLPSFGASRGRTGGKSPIVYLRENYTLLRQVLNEDRTPFSLTGKTLKFIVEYNNGLDRLELPDSSISVSVDDPSWYSVLIPDSLTDKEQSLHFALRDAGLSNTLYDKGEIEVQYAPA